MLLRPLLAAAGLTATAQAFLLPPEISSHDIDILESIPFESVTVAQAQTVDLDCPGCPRVFNQKHHGKGKHNEQPSSHLQLDFSIDQADGGDRLMLNGFELYPNLDPFSSQFVAPQVADRPKHHKDHKDQGEEDNTKSLLSHHKFRPGEGNGVIEQTIGFVIHFHPLENTADDELDLIVIDLHIIEVGLTFVDGLPNVRVSLIKLPGDELLLAKIEQIETESVSTPMEDDKECTNMLCKWKAVVAEKFNKMKPHGCHGMMGAQPENNQAPPRQPNGLFDKPHGWTLLFRKLTSNIILPVLVGIVAGVSVSIVGMVVGTLLVGVWRKFFRGQTFFPQHRHRSHSGACHHHKAARMEAAAVEEKAGLIEEHVEELPPAYKDDEVVIVEARTDA